jgi:hypothetical protein
MKDVSDALHGVAHYTAIGDASLHDFQAWAWLQMPVVAQRPDGSAAMIRGLKNPLDGLAAYLASSAGNQKASGGVGDGWFHGVGIYISGTGGATALSAAAAGNEIEECPMHAGIVGELGMERSCHHSSLPHGDRIVAFGRDDFDPWPDALDLRRADEHHFDGRPAEAAFTDGAVHLPAVGVAADADVESAQPCLFGIVHLVSQKNRTGTSAKRWPGAHKLLQLLESGFAQEFEKCAGFAAGNYQAVDFVELLRFFYEHNFGSQLFEPATVGVEIALQGQDTDFHASLILLHLRRGEGGV